MDEIRRPVESQMSLYEEYLQNILGKSSSRLKLISGEVFSRRGKSIRPLIIILSSEMFPDVHGKEERSRLAAMLVEMVHTSSLIHDDVIDRAYIRRGAPSVNALWGDHLAVLAGDYIISRAFAEGLSSGHYDIISKINDTLLQICEGEMIQSYQSSSLKMTREIYLDIITKKTGLLISTSAAAGAMSARADAEQVEAMASYGRNLGIAFQMRDDALDYAPQSQTGKPACGDLRERKITMPLLAVLEKSDEKRRGALLKKLSDIRRHPENAEYLHQAVVDGGGLEDTAMIMQQYADQAKAGLAQFPASPAKSSLISLCDYVTQRTK